MTKDAEYWKNEILKAESYLENCKLAFENLKLNVKEELSGMVHDKSFRKWLDSYKNCPSMAWDLSYNQGSKYYNNKEIRIAYYKFKGEI